MMCAMQDATSAFEKHSTDERQSKKQKIRESRYDLEEEALKVCCKFVFKNRLQIIPDKECTPEQFKQFGRKVTTQ
jgi:hypothetical protein